MLEFFIAGGWMMWTVLIFGGICLISAARFAWRADMRRLAGIRALSVATVFAVLTSVAGDFIKVMWRLSRDEKFAHRPDLHLFIMSGLGESLTPAELGFAMLTLTWLFVAVGMRRTQDRTE